MEAKLKNLIGLLIECKCMFSHSSNKSEEFVLGFLSLCIQTVLFVFFSVAL